MILCNLEQKSPNSLHSILDPSCLSLLMSLFILQLFLNSNIPWYLDHAISRLLLFSHILAFARDIPQTLPPPLPPIPPIYTELTLFRYINTQEAYGRLRKCSHYFDATMWTSFHNIYEKMMVPFVYLFNLKASWKGILSNIFSLLLISWVFNTAYYMLKSHLLHEWTDEHILYVYAPMPCHTLIHLADIIKSVI